MYVLPHAQRVCALAADFRFWRGVWDHFRAWKCIGAQGCVLLAPGRPKVLHNALRDDPKCPKGLQKFAFRLPWATLLEQIGERVVFAKNKLFIMFSSHRATPGLSTVALLAALDTECVPEPAFCVPWRPPVRPSVAAGRHREPNVTPNGLKKRPGDLQKAMKNPCCGRRGALGALGVSPGTPHGSKKFSKYRFPYACRTSERTLRSRRSAGTRTNKIAMVSSPRNMFSKSWRWFCPPRAPANKLAMVSSLQTVFQKMPLAPAFLSSSTTRRHNNARPPPVHTLLSAAAERSSYGL